MGLFVTILDALWARVPGKWGTLFRNSRGCSAWKSLPWRIGVAAGHLRPIPRIQISPLFSQPETCSWPRSRGVKDLMVMCPSCFVRLKQAEREILTSVEKAQELERVFHRKYRGGVRLRFFLEILEQIGLERVKEIMRNPFHGLKVALYYGCLLSRPDWITGFDVAPYERFLEELVRIAGADPVRWPYSKHCCGASLAVTKPETSDRLVDRIRHYALEAKAQCIVVFCSLCQMNLELRGKASSPLPVLYITELLALAAGSPNARKWLSKHLIDPLPLLREQMSLARSG
jgi:heterodisulfide reductase subunit B